jgi:dihydroxy-acid dehydratase
MPEAGYIPIPKKLAQLGVKDMVRISDARMSGTAFGTIVLHITPEAAIGGPLAWVRNGDTIRLDVEKRSIGVSQQRNSRSEALGVCRPCPNCRPRVIDACTSNTSRRPSWAATSTSCCPRR